MRQLLWRYFCSTSTGTPRASLIPRGDQESVDRLIAAAPASRTPEGKLIT
ncbi:MAG: hypothetical protein IPM35_10200 [Myxococcales bacterium]|nr:hypothetical protein [Myxococcales bacterium]